MTAAHKSRMRTIVIAVPVLTMALVSIYALIGSMLEWDQATFLHKSIGGRGASITHEPLLMLPEAPLLMAVMLVPFVALCVGAGMSWSLKAKGVLGAVIPSVAIIGGLSLVLGLCGWHMAAGVPLLGPVVNAFSPATNLFMLVNPWDRVNSFTESPKVHRIGLVFAAACAAVGYGLIVYALVVGMVKGFDQTVRRLSGTG